MDIRKAFLRNGRSEEYARVGPEDRCRGCIAITQTADSGLRSGREKHSLCKEICACVPGGSVVKCSVVSPFPSSATTPPGNAFQ